MLRNWLNYAGRYCGGLNEDGASKQKEPWTDFRDAMRSEINQTLYQGNRWQDRERGGFTINPEE